jgi:two-component system, NarL family, nitrate/nitrite response regulator NarL
MTTDVIDVAAVEDNRMFADGLRAWAATLPDIRLAMVTSAIEELLRTSVGRRFVVLLNPALRADPDPAQNVRRLVEAGHRVVVIDGSVDLTVVARTVAAGAHGYLTHNHDMAALAATLRAIAAGGTAWSLGPTMASEPAGLPTRPPLSEREHAVLMAYISGLTLESTARSLGISTETAKTYLKRVKAKYRDAGLPVYTKLDLAERVRADCSSRTGLGAARGVRS